VIRRCERPCESPRSRGDGVASSSTLLAFLRRALLARDDPDAINNFFQRDDSSRALLLPRRPHHFRQLVAWNGARKPHTAGEERRGGRLPAGA
jgi:hypothetical protein